MKILKYALGILLILAAIFFIRGLLTPEISYTSEVTVDKTAKEAWAVMSDESKLPEWISGFKKTELVSGEPNTVGAKSKIYVEENGQEMVMEETLTKVVPNETMGMTFTMDFMDMDYEMNMKEEKGKTKLTSKSTTRGNGLFAKSMVAFMKGQ